MNSNAGRLNFYKWGLNFSLNEFLSGEWSNQTGEINLSDAISPGLT